MRSFNWSWGPVQAGKDWADIYQAGNRLLTAIRLSGLMIGKLGMSVQDSIAEYQTISESIFKDGRHLRGKFSKGVLLPRYCGKRFSKTIDRLFRSKNTNCNLPMSGCPDDFTHWYETIRPLTIIKVADLM